MSNEPSGERTEQATPQRMKKVREEGKLQRSQDISAWIGLGAAALMIPMVFNGATDLAQEAVLRVRDVIINPSTVSATDALYAGLGDLTFVMAPMYAAVFITVIAVAATQGGIRVRKFKPKFQQFNIAKGLKNLFSVQTLWQGVKALVKSLVVGLVLYFTVQGLIPTLLGSGQMSLASVLSAAGEGAGDLMRLGIIAGIVMAVADVAYVMKRNRKQTRMTKQEVKEENKRTEGDPLIKQAVRSKQMQMSRNRMMSEVTKSDVVLVNPTHVAVALRYEPGKGAPRVVAKGEGFLAAKMRKVAEENHVPMVQDVPLARALFSACEVGQEIPAELFTNVARVLAFVMSLRKRGAAMGQHKLPPAARVPVPELPKRRGRRRWRKSDNENQ